MFDAFHLCQWLSNHQTDLSALFTLIFTFETWPPFLWAFYSVQKVLAPSFSLHLQSILYPFIERINFAGSAIFAWFVFDIYFVSLL